MARCPNCNQDVSPTSPDVVGMQRMAKVPATLTADEYFVEARDVQFFHQVHAPRVSDDWRPAIINLNDGMPNAANDEPLPLNEP